VRQETEQRKPSVSIECEDTASETSLEGRVEDTLVHPTLLLLVEIKTLEVMLLAMAEIDEAIPTISTMIPATA